MDTVLPMDRIIEAINDPRVFVISFDIFGTLLSWSAIHPKDIVRFAVRRIEAERCINLETARLNAPLEMENPCASLEAIWERIASGCDMTASEARMLAQREASIEADLCLCRQSGRLLYDRAIASGKRVIAVSDMFLSADHLKSMLSRHGYDQLSHIYVSNEIGSVKRDGGLYAAVLRCEGLSDPGAMVHIGDNARSDGDAALEKGIRAFLVPSEAALLQAKLGCDCRLPELGGSVYASIIMGYARHCAVDGVAACVGSFALEDYARIIAFPILLHTTLFLLQSDAIRLGEYKAVSFLSRDGFLFYQAYQMLRGSGFQGTPDARYLPASRTACRCLAEREYEDSLRARYIPETCTLEGFLTRYFNEDNLGRRICGELSEREKVLRVKAEAAQCRQAMLPYADVLKAAHSAKRAAAMRFYDAVFKGSRAELLMDCGFCGTIAAYLSRGFDGRVRFDKVFLWQNDKNALLDDVLGSRTYTAFDKKGGHGIAALMEATFSERAGSVTAFVESKEGFVDPVRERFDCSAAMERDLTRIQREALNTLRSFASMMGDGLRHFEPGRLPEVMELIPLCINERTFTLFDHICFEDVFRESGETPALGKILEERSHLHEEGARADSRGAKQRDPN